MKCVIPEISWHNRDPVLSVDFQPKRSNDPSDLYRLATGGTDTHVLIWYVSLNETGTIQLDIAADLTRHQKAVNAVRWSPSGEYLASGDDESVIFIWKLKGDTEIVNILDNTDDQDKEIWLTYKILRGHMNDVYDLSWSPNSLNLISGSVDNTAMVWDVQKGKSLNILGDHKSFVQGVAWDPKNQYLATLSTDRYMRVFNVKTKKLMTRSSKCALPVPEESPLHGKVFRIFHDDTLQTFYRRLCFSPDGELIFTPSGVAELNENDKPIHTTYIYTRYNTRQPAIVLPSPDQYTIAVRCCPLLFELREHDEDKPSVITLPYRMVFAVATKSSVYLYDTQQPMPIGIISNIHYTRLTDMTWSSDGLMLIVSSTDGFCTMITFAADELGTLYTPPADSAEVADDTKDGIMTLSSEDDNSVTPTTDLSNTDDKGVGTNGIQLNGLLNGVILLDQPIEPPKIEAVAAKKDFSNSAPMPIAIRRKPRSAAEVEAATKKTNGTASTESSAVLVVKTPDKIISLEIPPSIISSHHKFDSPEIVNKPATPIQIRREPRNPSTPNSIPKSSRSTTPTASQFKLDKVNDDAAAAESFTTPSKTSSAVAGPTSNSLKKAKKSKSVKKATPIAVRRHQRNILPTPETAVVRCVSEEEALDAWPIDQPRPVTMITADSALAAKLSNPDTDNDDVQFIDPVDKDSNTPAANGTVHPMDIDETEDIRLVYDDESQTDMDDQAMVLNGDSGKAVEQQLKSPIKENGTEHTPNSKTPRRVELRTISTPKSKKKLL